MKKEKKKLWDILKENGAKIFFTCLALLILCASTTALSICFFLSLNSLPNSLILLPRFLVF